MIPWLIPLICAHVLGDFLLQPNWMAGDAKKCPWILALHAVLHGLLGYVLTQQWMLWPLGVVIFLSHTLIDFCKVRCQTSPLAFAFDQLAHLLVLWILAAWGKSVIPNPHTVGLEPMLLLAGLVAAVWGAGHFIRTVADRLCEQNPALSDELSHGLKNGGAMIGRLERALIFLLVFLGHPGGVGFLVAAKSIIRFEEAKNQHLAEYVLIGTLWSFGLSMAIAGYTAHLLGQL